MLDMRPDCERCGTDLPAEAPGAFICSFECTFCAECADQLDAKAWLQKLSSSRTMQSLILSMPLPPSASG